MIARCRLCGMLEGFLCRVAKELRAGGAELFLFVWQKCHMYYLFLPGGVLILILSALRSAAIWLKMAANLGLLPCMRLLDASAMSIASLRYWISLSVNNMFQLRCLCSDLHGLDITMYGVSLSSGLAKRPLDQPRKKYT